MAESKSRFSEKQRKKFLRQHGFTQVADRGKGTSHQIWEHAKLKRLTALHDIELPKTGNEQSAYSVTIPNDPADGLWRRIAKYVEAADKAVKDHERSEVNAQFRKAVNPQHPAAGKQTYQNTTRVGMAGPAR